MRHCFEVHVALDAGVHDPADVMAAVERVLAEARDGLVLLQVDLGGTGDVSITVEDAWPVGDTGSTQPLVDELLADEELLAKLRRVAAGDDPLADLQRAVTAAKAACERLLAQHRGGA